MYIDYAGDQLEIVDEATGEVRCVEVFVAILPCSHYTYCVKAAVILSDRNEPVINDDFAALAEFYDIAVYPARARHPKDKALVENAVKLMYRSVYMDIEGMVFQDPDSLNAAIRVSLTKHMGESL